MLQIGKFASKPFLVEAVEVTSENMEEVAEWCKGTIEVLTQLNTDHTVSYIDVQVTKPLKVRHTQAFVGDWVICTSRGFKVYTADSFLKGFEPTGTTLIVS